MGREGRGGKGGEHRGGEGKRREGGEGTGREGTPPIFYCTPSSSFLEICLDTAQKLKEINSIGILCCDST